MCFRVFWGLGGEEKKKASKQEMQKAGARNRDSEVCGSHALYLPLGPLRTI
jgi:hypothetical protein